MLDSRILPYLNQMFPFWSVEDLFFLKGHVNFKRTRETIWAVSPREMKSLAVHSHLPFSFTLSFKGFSADSLLVHDFIFSFTLPRIYQESFLDFSFFYLYSLWKESWWLSNHTLQSLPLLFHSPENQSYLPRFPFRCCCGLNVWVLLKIHLLKC